MKTPQRKPNKHMTPMELLVKAFIVKGKALDKKLIMPGNIELAEAMEGLAKSTKK